MRALTPRFNSVPDVVICLALGEKAADMTRSGFWIRAGGSAGAHARGRLVRRGGDNVHAVWVKAALFTLSSRPASVRTSPDWGSNGKARAGFATDALILV